MRPTAASRSVRRARRERAARAGAGVRAISSREKAGWAVPVASCTHSPSMSGTPATPRSLEGNRSRTATGPPAAGRGGRRPGDAAPQRLHPQPLPALAPAVNPEGHGGVGRALNARVVQVQRLPGAGGNADGASGADGAVQPKSAGPAPGLPAVLEGVGVDHLARRRRGRWPSPERDGRLSPAAPRLVTV